MNKPDPREIYLQHWNKRMEELYIDGKEGIMPTLQHYKDYGRRYINENAVTLAAMEEYGKQMFNYALELAAENAKTLYSYDELVLDPASIIVDKESILKIKIP